MLSSSSGCRSALSGSEVGTFGSGVAGRLASTMHNRPTRKSTATTSFMGTRIIPDTLSTKENHDGTYLLSNRSNSSLRRPHGSCPYRLSAASEHRGEGRPASQTRDKQALLQ